MAAKAPTEELQNLKIEAQDGQSKKADSAVPGVNLESPKAEKKHARKQSTDVVDVKTLGMPADDVAAIFKKKNEYGPARPGIPLLFRG